MDEYWSVKERDNFAKYCHPMRNDIRTQFSEVVIVVILFYFLYTQVESQIHLLDLKKVVEKITVVKQYKARCASEGSGERFDHTYDTFLRKLCAHCGYSIDDVYFEDLPIIVRNTLYIEVTVGQSQKLS